jgi:hypothetical protein
MDSSSPDVIRIREGRGRLAARQRIYGSPGGNCAGFEALEVQ